MYINFSASFPTSFEIIFRRDISSSFTVFVNCCRRRLLCPTLLLVHYCRLLCLLCVSFAVIVRRPSSPAIVVRRHRQPSSTLSPVIAVADRRQHRQPPSFPESLVVHRHRPSSSVISRRFRPLFSVVCCRQLYCPSFVDATVRRLHLCCRLPVVLRHRE